VLSDRFDAEARWWRHEELHRRALNNYPAVIAAIADERDGLETGFAADPSDIAACWRKADAAEARWRALAFAAPPVPQGNAFLQSWRDHNRIAGLPDDATQPL
jgi:hypothetical protein